MFKKFKILVSPLKYVKGNLAINLIGEFYDGFQSVFKVQVIAFIITAVQSKTLEDFYFWVGVFVVISVLSIIIGFIRPLFFVKAFFSLGHILNSIYLHKFIRLDNNRIETLGTGRSYSIVSKGVDSWVEIVLSIGMNLVVIVFSIIYAFVTIAFNVSFYHFIIVLSIFILLTFIVFKGINASLENRRKRKNEATEYDRSMLKIVMSKFEVLQNNKFEKEKEKLGNILSRILMLSRKEELSSSSWTSLNLALLILIQLLVFFWLGLGVIRGEVSFSQFIVINGLLDVISSYLWQFAREIRKIGVRIVDVDKLLEVFDDITEIPGINNPIPFTYKNGDISIKNINYGYSDDNIFNDFSLELKGMTKTALVGDSGSGKTTLMKLLAGYINPKSGKIIVDDQDLSLINLISYYKNIGYLTQEPSVFDGTIMENLVYALQDNPTKEEIESVIKNAKCEFILDLPEGMNTEIGERGIKLSGGQKQRLAIAKIMLKNPNIILLDEPTSALDSISEQVVSEALHNLFKGRTVIVIAHRLQTVKEADEIIVLKDGKIIERGNHESLSKKKDGVYKRMLELQTSF